MNENSNDFGHTCVRSINFWIKCYIIKQALFDIFCLFFIQSPEGPFSVDMTNEYLHHPEKFNAEARKWTKKYAGLDQIYQLLW